VAAARFLQRFFDRNERRAGLSAGIYLTKHGMNRSSKVARLIRIVWQFYIARQTQSIANRIAIESLAQLELKSLRVVLRSQRCPTRTQFLPQFCWLPVAALALAILPRRRQSRC
jgi:hypothetical protein